MGMDSLRPEYRQAARRAGQVVGRAIAEFNPLGKTRDELLKGASAEPKAWSDPIQRYVFPDGRTAELDGRQLTIKNPDQSSDTVTFGPDGRARNHDASRRSESGLWTTFSHSRVGP